MICQEKKKHKRHKHDREDALDQNKFGKYGIIRESDLFKFQREFEAYMDEVKHIDSISGLSRREVIGIKNIYYLNE